MRFDRHIEIQTLAITVDEYGDQIEDWSTLSTVSANYTPMSDAEKHSFGTFGVESGRFVIRWFPDFETTLAEARLIFNGRSFKVLGAKEVGRRKYIELTAENVDNA